MVATVGFIPLEQCISLPEMLFGLQLSIALGRKKATDRTHS